MENIYSNLHRKYAVSKTLRFELRPIGKTKENIEKNGLLEEDEYRDAIYKNVKKYCDEVHKYCRFVKHMSHFLRSIYI